MSERPEPGAPQEEQRWSWSFILLIVAAVIYLGWRAVQGIAWLVNWVGS